MMSGSIAIEPEHRMTQVLRRLAFLLTICAAATLPAAAIAQHGAIAQVPGTFAFLGYRAPVPTTWEVQAPSSTMRVTQYRVPGVGKGGDGEAIVFYFGKGQGGAVQANINRWASQFSTPEGRPVAPRVQKQTVNGVPVTLVELNGNYARGVGTGPQGAAKANQTLLVAVFETPDGNLTFQLHGGRDTVAAQRKGWDALVRGFKKST
jgi:hypothetical protein